MTNVYAGSTSAAQEMPIVGVKENYADGPGPAVMAVALCGDWIGRATTRTRGNAVSVTMASAHIAFIQPAT